MSGLKASSFSHHNQPPQPPTDHAETCSAPSITLLEFKETFYLTEPIAHIANAYHDLWPLTIPLIPLCCLQAKLHESEDSIDDHESFHDSLLNIEKWLMIMKQKLESFRSPAGKWSIEGRQHEAEVCVSVCALAHLFSSNPQNVSLASHLYTWNTDALLHTFRNIFVVDTTNNLFCQNIFHENIIIDYMS